MEPALAYTRDTALLVADCWAAPKVRPVVQAVHDLVAAVHIHGSLVSVATAVAHTGLTGSAQVALAVVDTWSKMVRMDSDLEVLTAHQGLGTQAAAAVAGLEEYIHNLAEDLAERRTDGCRRVNRSDRWLALVDRNFEALLQALFVGVHRDLSLGLALVSVVAVDVRSGAP